jgi:hypothetical protein
MLICDQHNDSGTLDIAYFMLFNSYSRCLPRYLHISSPIQVLLTTLYS